jgi:hypothetical protein
MAEFKLGRIRFVWKDQWTTGTTYYVDDVVRNGGKTYICAVGHTAAADFYTDLDYSPTKWNQLTDGQEWKGDWTTDTRYKLNDIVKYGGNTYLCNLGHTSAPTLAMGLEGLDRLVSGQTADIDKWDQFSEAFDWKGDWTPGTRYKINDVVSFGGTSYVCNEGHPAAATFALGLEEDQSKWDYFNQGIEYLGLWDADEQHYKVNDLVKTGNGVYICLQKHTSSLARTFEQDEDSGYWAQFLEGIQFEDSWSNSTIYQPGDIITYGGYAYVATTNHSNIKPTE